MKVLLDHNIPHSLRPLLSGEHEVYTTKYVHHQICWMVGL